MPGFVNIPNEVLYDTHMSPSDATAFARQMVALGYYTAKQRVNTILRKIAGMSKEDFILFL